MVNKTPSAAIKARSKFLAAVLFACALSLCAARAAAAPAFETRTLDLRQPPPGVTGRVQWRAFIDAEQKPVLEALEKLKTRGEVTSWKKHWLLNSIRVTGTAAAFAELANLQQVDGIDTREELQASALPPAPDSGDTIRNTTAAGDNEYFQIRDSFVYEVWAKYNLRGQGMTIGMVDSGIDPDHPDLAGKIAGFKIFDEDGVDLGLPAADNYPTVYSGSGHGTSVAGLLIGGNASGKYIGVAPEAKIMVSTFNVPSKVNDGKTFPSKEALLTSYEWLSDPDGNPATDDGVHIISGSYGGLQNDTYVEFARGMYQNNVLLVNALGNSGPGYETTISPGNIPGYVIGVGAGGPTSERGILSVKSYSSRGPAKWNYKELSGSYIKPDITSPSGNNYTSTVGGGYTATFGGTSAATPVTSGVCLLLLQAKPSLTPGEIMQILRDTASVKDTGTSYLQVPNNDWGHGFLNASRAADLVLHPGAVTVQLDIGAAASASIRIRGTGFTRGYSASSTLSFDYATGSYNLEVITDQLKTKVFPFTVSEGQTTTITGSVDGDATDSGLLVTSQSAGLASWYITANGTSTTVVDVRLLEKVAYTDGASTTYRTVPAAGIEVRLSATGQVTIPSPTLILDGAGEAKFTVVAGTQPGRATLTLTRIDPSDNSEVAVESYVLYLLPQRRRPAVISNVSSTPANPAVSEPVTISADVYSPESGTVEPAINYSFDGGSTWYTAAMSQSAGNTWTAILPGLPDKSVMRYYVTATDSFGNFTSESRGVVTDWTTTSTFKGEATPLPDDDYGEPIAVQIPNESGSTMLADPLTPRRDVTGPLAAGNDVLNYYFLMRLREVLEPADNLMDPKNAFLFGVEFWPEDVSKGWEVGAAVLPGAWVLDELGLPGVAYVTPAFTYETDQDVWLGFGDGEDLIFKVTADRMRKHFSGDSIIYSFGSLAVNIERFYVIEMDITRLYRFYPRTHFYTVPGGNQTARLDQGWNLAGAGVLAATENPAYITSDNSDIWCLSATGALIPKADPLFSASRPDQAVFLYASQSLEALTVPTTSPATGTIITLIAGWNAFANPYPFDLTWDDGITFTDTSTGEEKALSSAYAAGWLPSTNCYVYFTGNFAKLKSGATLPPGRGCAIRAKRALNMRLPAP